MTARRALPARSRRPFVKSAVICALALGAVAAPTAAMAAAFPLHPEKTAVAAPVPAPAFRAAQPGAPIALAALAAGDGADLAASAHPAAAVAKPAAAPRPAAVAVAAPVIQDYGRNVPIQQLEPLGVNGGQAHFTLSGTQYANAKTIVDQAHKLAMPVRAAVIAVATAMQESKLQNLTVAVDHDSLGLFQQRPSCGWGAPSQLTTPSYAAWKFLSTMKSTVPGYASMPLYRAAQTVQGSAFPYAYAQWEDEAAHVVQQVAG